MPGAEQQAEAAAADERETRLARVVDQLRRRLEQQQAENEQLEDLLRQADASLNGVLSRPPVHAHLKSQRAILRFWDTEIYGARGVSPS